MGLGVSTILVDGCVDIVLNFELPTNLVNLSDVGFVMNDNDDNDNVSLLTDKEVDIIVENVCKRIIFDWVRAFQHGDPKEDAIRLRPVIKHMYFRTDEEDINSWSDEKVVEFASANFLKFELYP